MCCPKQGHFSKNGVETPCKGSAPGTSTGWENPQPSDVTSDTICEFDCANGRTASSTKGSGGTCDIDAGHVATGGPTSKNPATLCTGGTVPNTGKDKCVNPAKGHYSKSGVETPCTTIEHSTWKANTGALNADSCPFTCNSNYGPNAAGTGCLTCGAGEHLISGACTGVQGNYVSAASDITQKECTGSSIPKTDKSDCISNICSIDDGTGTIAVEGGSCQLTSCDAGFYEKDSNSCTEVEVNSGYYSEANDEDVTQCSDTITKPNDSHWTNSAGSDDSGDCSWNCNASHSGYNGVCYANTQVCPILDKGIEIGKGTQTYTAGTAGDYGTCQGATSCVSTHSIYSGTCYMNSKECTSSELATISSHATAGTRTYDASANNGTYKSCVVGSCATGYVKRNNDCEVPGNGKYADNTDNSEKDCDKDGSLGIDTQSGAAFITPSGGETQTTACNFTCPDGKVKNTVGRICDVAGEGTYVVNNVQHNCWADDKDATTDATAESAAELGRRKGTAWATSQNNVTQLSECKLAGCLGSKVFKDNKKAECKNLPTNHYKDSDHTSESCGTPPTSSTGWNSDQSGVSQKANCKFTCVSGRTISGTGESGSCTLNQGYFATTANDATSCGTAPGSSTGWENPQPSSVTSATECIFECESGRTASSTKGSGGSCEINAGHVVTRGPASNDAATPCTGGKVPHTNKKSCVDPKQGYFSKNGIETPCKGNPPATSTGWTSVQPSTVKSDTTCEFDCASSRSPVGTGSNGKCSIPNGHIATGNGAPTQCTNGEVPNTAQNKCVAPKQGHFSKNGIETPCKGSAPGTSTGWENRRTTFGQ